MSRLLSAPRSACNGARNKSPRSAASHCLRRLDRDLNYANSQSTFALYQSATMRRFLTALLSKCHPDDRSKEGEVDRARGTFRKSRGAYRILIGNPEWKRPHRRSRRRWEANTKMDLKETDLEGMDFTYLVQEGDKWRTLVNAVMNLRVP